MAINIFTDRMQHAELFGKPVLTTNWLIPRETVPEGWHCYDMRGTERNPAAHAELVDYTTFYHSGTVLSPEPLKPPDTAVRQIGKGDYFLHGEEMDLEEFCEEYALDYPDNPIRFEMRPASPDEAGIFYALDPAEDERLGTVGHVRIDFGRGGQEFWHTWWPRGPEELNTPEFKGELGQVMDELRRGVLKDLSNMRRWCHGHGGEISGGICGQNYGYVVETERYRYCLRCNPVEGDYQAYLTCFDLRAQQMGLTEKGREMNDKFFPELARRLRQQSIETGQPTESSLPVLVDGQEAMWVEPRGTIILNAGAVDDPKVNRTYDTVAGVSAQVHEYITAMETAPRLEAVGLDEDFRLLAEFNGVVLAGQELERDWGYKFVTWRRDGDGSGVAHGNYYHNDYAGAKLDFACRSGLVQDSRQFTDEQLAEMYRCIHETLDSEYPITEEREKILTAAAEQIDRSVDDLNQRVEQSNQRELEAADEQDRSGLGMEMAP